MYVYAPNQTAEKYPYSIGDLRKDNPNVSFPRNPSIDLLAGFSVYPVVITAEPDYDPVTQIVNQDGCAYIAERQRWETIWTVRNKTAEEITADNQRKADSVRSERNRLLAASDWTQVLDTVVNQASWAAYRQALRDVPSQSGFPWNVTWPTEP